MRYCLFLLLLLAVLPASAQIFVDKVDVNARPVQYVELWEKYNKDNGKFFAMLDYGQQDDLKDREGKSLFVTNKDGQYIEFNSMVGVLNFMYRNGWKVLDSKTTGKVQSYILEKRTDYFVNASVKNSNNTFAKNVQIKTGANSKEKAMDVAKTITNTPKAKSKQKVEVSRKADPVPDVVVKRVPKKEEETTKEKEK